MHTLYKILIAITIFFSFSYTATAQYFQREELYWVGQRANAIIDQYPYQYVIGTNVRNYDTLRGFVAKISATTGDSIWTTSYQKTNYQHLLNDAIVLNNKIFAFGTREDISNGYYKYDYNTFMLALNTHTADTLYTNIYKEGIINRAIYDSAQNKFAVAGNTYVQPEITQKKLYFLVTDTTGNKLWDTTYIADWAKKNSFFTDVLPDNNGGYYLLGTINFVFEHGDILLLHIDSVGNILKKVTFDIGTSDVSEFFSPTSDGGLLIAGVDADVPIIIQYGYFIKVDANWDIEWFSNKWFTGSKKGVETPDGNFVLTGADWIDGNGLDEVIVKVDPQGNLLWKKNHGLPGSTNYGYNMTPNTRGGWAVCGRTDYEDTIHHKISGKLYLLNTNCMGLLDLPIADFNYFLTNTPNKIHFNNLSQYVFKDSIDGGRFIWDFGDETPTSALTNPTHQYATPGSYQVTLTAIACVDTNVITHTIHTQFANGVQQQTPTPPTFTVFPNPAQNTLNISSNQPNNQPTLINILDLSGKIILHKKTYAPNCNLDITNLKNGMYLYQIIQTTDKDQFIQQNKIIILK